MLSSKRYIERRLIVVSDKAVLEAAEKEEKRHLEGNKVAAVGQQALLTTALRIASQTMAWESALPKFLIGFGVEAYGALKKAREKGLDIRPITFEDAEELTFPPGHPRQGVVYVCHPVKPDTYYTMADFHRVVFEHKFAEALVLLMSLGARIMHVEHVIGWSSEFLGNIKIPIPGQPANLGVDVGRNSKENKKLMFSAMLNGSHTPMIPPGLAWFPHEEMWMAIAKGRMDYGLSDFNLTISYRDDYGIDSKLSGQIQGAGLEIGGKFEDHKATIWQIDGSFSSALDGSLIAKE